MMNKYEEAFNVIETILHLMCGEEREDNYKPSHDEMVNSMEDFKELVERATPQKLLYNGEYVSFCNCPNCKKVVPIHGNYCPRCSQALDWRVEND